MVRTLAAFTTVVLLGASVSSARADDYGNLAPAPAATPTPAAQPPPPPPPMPLPNASGGANTANPVASADQGAPSAPGTTAPVSGGYYLDGQYYAPGTGPIANPAQPGTAPIAEPAPAPVVYSSSPPPVSSPSWLYNRCCCGGLFGRGGFLGTGLFR